MKLLIEPYAVGSYFRIDAFLSVSYWLIYNEKIQKKKIEKKESPSYFFSC